MPGGMRTMGPQKTSSVHIINLGISQRFLYQKRSSGVCFQLYFPDRDGQ